MQITVELTEDQAAALAQFCKRMRHDLARSIAVDDAEAFEMMAGVDAVRAALADAGYNPR